MRLGVHDFVLSLFLSVLNSFDSYCECVGRVLENSSVALVTDPRAIL